MFLFDQINESESESSQDTYCRSVKRNEPHIPLSPRICAAQRERASVQYVSSANFGKNSPPFNKL